MLGVSFINDGVDRRHSRTCLQQRPGTAQ